MAKIPTISDTQENASKNLEDILWVAAKDKGLHCSKYEKHRRKDRLTGKVVLQNRVAGITKLVVQKCQGIAVGFQRKNDQQKWPWILLKWFNWNLDSPRIWVPITPSSVLISHHFPYTVIYLQLLNLSHSPRSKPRVAWVPTPFLDQRRSLFDVSVLSVRRAACPAGVPGYD